MSPKHPNAALEKLRKCLDASTTQFDGENPFQFKHLPNLLQEFGPKSLLSVTPGKSSQNALQQGKHDLSSRQQPVHTLVMGCLHDTAADELAAAVACALKVLAWAIQVGCGRIHVWR